MELNIIYILVMVAIIIFSMTLHEISHAYVAYWLGDQTPKAQGRLSLNPLKHLDPFMSLVLPLMLALAGAPIFGGARPVQINSLKLKWGEWGMALVAVAGPLTNLLLAYVSFCIFYYAGPHMTIFWATFFVMAVQINLGFCLFNLIPIPPLDGSRVLYALAPEFIQNAMRKIEHFGIVAVFFIVMIAGSLLSQFIGIGVTFIIEIFYKLMI